MKHKRIIILVITILSVSSSVVHAKGTSIDWGTPKQEVIELYKAGKNIRAIIVAQKALEIEKANVGLDRPDEATQKSCVFLSGHKPWRCPANTQETGGKGSSYVEIIPIFKTTLNENDMMREEFKLKHIIHRRRLLLHLWQGCLTV